MKEIRRHGNERRSAQRAYIKENSQNSSAL
jgi:hypothetical protein